MVGLGWYLDVIGSDSHDVFLVLIIFGEKSQKGKNQTNWASRAPLLQRRAPSPRCSPTPQRGLPRRDEAKGPENPPPPPPPPRVCQGVALLRQGEVLRRSVAVLRYDEVTVHSGQFSDFCF